ncbi:hypothetical protein ACWFMI_14910 [Nocardiopsis terrae]
MHIPTNAPMLAATRRPRHSDCRCQEIDPTSQRHARRWIKQIQRSCKRAARQHLKRELRHLY